MSPVTPRAINWTPTRNRALKLVGDGKVRRFFDSRGNHLSVAGVTPSEQRAIAKAVLFLEEVRLVRTRAMSALIDCFEVV